MTGIYSLHHQINTRVNPPNLPQFVGAVDFYKSIGTTFESGVKFLRLGVLRPDATLNGKPIFLADFKTVEKAKTAIAQFRARHKRQLDNLKELAHA